MNPSLSTVEPLPGTKEYGDMLTAWEKTDSYKLFKAWYGKHGHRFQCGKWTHDFMAGDIWRAIESVQTTNNLASKDSGEASKEVVTPSPQPEPSSTVMPDKVQLLINHIALLDGSPGFNVTASSLFIKDAIPDIRAAYQRIAELESSLSKVVDITGKVTRDQIDELKTQLAAAKQDYMSSCNLVATMHAAALGEIRGPVRGPVEDIKSLRDKLTQLKSQLAAMKKAGHEMYRDISILNQELTVGQEAWIAAVAASNNQGPRPAPACDKPQPSAPPPQCL